jgi:hypothetical protein
MTRPLPRRNEKGELYTLPPGIETIDVALGQDLAMLAKSAFHRSPLLDYLPSECLVHPIREAIRRRNESLATALLPTFLIRCEANLLKKVPDSRMRNAEAIREELPSSFELMIAEDSTERHQDELDYHPPPGGGSGLRKHDRTTPHRCIEPQLSAFRRS